MRSPETGSLILGYRDLSRQQRPQVSHLNPRKCPQIAGYLAETRNGRLASNCVVVDAAPIEPVSSVKFPDNWENTGNFTHFDPAIRFRGLIREQLQSLTEKFPAQRNWEFLWRNRETKRWNREVEKLRRIISLVSGPIDQTSQFFSPAQVFVAPGVFIPPDLRSRFVLYFKLGNAESSDA